SAAPFPMVPSSKNILKVAKLYNMLRAEAGDTWGGRTAADNATVRYVFVRFLNYGSTNSVNTRSSALLPHQIQRPLQFQFQLCAFRQIQFLATPRFHQIRL